MFFDENRIVRSTRKRAYEPSQRVAVPPDDGETFVTSPAELQDIAQQLSHSFWNEKKNKKLFNSSDVKKSLESWISQLKAAEFDATELEKIVNKTESHPLEVHQAFSVQIRVMYLRRAYEFALHDMPGDRMSWRACCEQSIEVFENFGICKVQNYRTIQKWNVYFQTAGKFPHPNPFVELDKEVQPKLFRIFPEARDELRRWANQNLELLNSDFAAEFIRNDLINKFHEQYLNELEGNEVGLSKQDFVCSLNVKTIDTKTAYRWLKGLGFSYDVQKKVYFNDRHESPENVADRKEFIKKYFDYEMYAHRWVQVPVVDAQLFESQTDENGNKLMMGTWAIEYKNENGILMREYHVDCHLEFLNKYVVSEENKKLGGNLSIRKPVDCCP